MIEAGGSVQSAPLLFSVRIPNDERYVETVRDLAGRVAQYAGYAAPAVREISLAIEEAVGGALRHSSRTLTPVSIRFQTRNGRLEVELSFAGSAPSGSGGRLALGRMAERTMDRVEFGQDGELNVCRMVRRLPPPPNP